MLGGRQLLMLIWVQLVFSQIGSLTSVREASELIPDHHERTSSDMPRVSKGLLKTRTGREAGGRSRGIWADVCLIKFDGNSMSTCELFL